MRRCLGTLPWDNNDLGVVFKTVEVRTIVTPSILAQMVQVRSLSASTQEVDVDEVLA